MKKHLKTYEKFEEEIGKIWVIGMPSGEAFQLADKDLDTLVLQKIVKYYAKNNTIGFFTFEDKDVESVKKYVTPKKIPDKNFSVLRNEFSQIIIDTVVEMVRDYPSKAELYIQEETMGITFDNNYGQFYLEVEISADNDGYLVLKYHKGNIVDQYYVVEDTKLLKHIEEELYDYYYM
jgi:hypothetical protein